MFCIFCPCYMRSWGEVQAPDSSVVSQHQFCKTQHSFPSLFALHCGLPRLTSLQPPPSVMLQLPLPGYLLRAGYGQEFLRVTKCTNVLLCGAFRFWRVLSKSFPFLSWGAGFTQKFREQQKFLANKSHMWKQRKGDQRLFCPPKEMSA